jgi:ketosteroid isomerase-like protein
MNHLSKLTALTLCMTSMLSGCAATHRQQASLLPVQDHSLEVRAAAAEFVAAFNGLDQARFDALWAEDAIVFFPQPPFPIRRVEGKAEVASWFKRFMDLSALPGALSI